MTSQPPANAPSVHASGDKKDDEKKPDDKGGKDGPVRTQMEGEAPGEDLGYDPAIIPTEDIPDD